MVLIHEQGPQPQWKAICPGERPLMVATLNERFEGWLPAYMAGAA